MKRSRVRRLRHQQYQGSVMLKPSRHLQVSLAPLTGFLVLTAAVTQLTGCVVRAGVAAPAPPLPPVYVAPAPPAAEVDVQANEPPPPLPAYEQPPCPVEGYIWTPGYWAWAPAGYYWVPGTWVAPPSVGLLWTPGYWGYVGGVYVFNAGYWGPHVGFYGGVNYGYGYGGVGYEGGRWDNGVFVYNRTVNNFGNVTITHVYEKTVYVEPGASRVSFNGGSGGTTVRPTQEEQVATHEQHVAAAPSQLQHERTASEDKALLASENHGTPTVAATTKPGEFAGKGVVAATSTTALPGAGTKNPGSMGTNSPGAKSFEERGTGTGPSGTNPGGARSATNPTGAKTFEERGMGTGPSGTNPGGVGTSN